MFKIFGFFLLVGSFLNTSCKDKQTQFNRFNAKSNVGFKGSSEDSKGETGGKDDGGKDDGGKDSDPSPTPSETPTTEVSPTPSPSASITPAPGVPINAHLINNFPGVCSRIEVRGDNSSTLDFTGPKCVGANNLLQIHDFYSARGYLPATTTVKGSITKNHRSLPLPKDFNGDSIPDFPEVNFLTVSENVGGTLQSETQAVSSWHPDVQDGQSISGKKSGNVVIIGSREKPFKINGDVYIDGNLIIKGYYRGTGTVYVSGSIFIPADIIAGQPAFPFSTDKAAAASDAANKGPDKTDSLSLVSGNYIMAGDPYPIYSNPLINPIVQALYASLPSGKAGYKKYYEAVWNCQTGRFVTPTKAKYDQCDCNVRGGFNLIQANLYAYLAMVGSAGTYDVNDGYIPNSYAIDGTVLASKFDVLSLPEMCLDPNRNHPVHKYPHGKSYINLDFRLPIHGNGFYLLRNSYQ